MSGAPDAHRGATVAGRSPVAPGGSPLVVPIAGRGDDRWVSSAAVRQAIGAWAYSLGGTAHRPTDAEVRAAVALAHAICERVLDDDHRRFAERSGAGERPGSDRSDDAVVETAVSEDAADLAERAGIGRRELEAGLALLVASRAVVRHHGATVPTVALAPDLLTPLPAVRRVDWPRVRARLRGVGASIPPALAVLRGLGGLAGALPAGESPPPVRASVRDLEEATGFGRSTVSDALIALERASLLTAEVRAGRTTRFTLRPALYGLPDGPADAAEVASAPDDRPGARARGQAGIDPAPPTRHTSRSATTVPEPSGAPDGSRRGSQGAAPGRGQAPSSAGSIAPVTQHHDGRNAAPTLTFGGTPVHVPPGTPVALEQDAHGRWICRIGPLTLGPIDG